MKLNTQRIALFCATLGLAGCGNLLEAGFDLDKPGHSPSMTAAGFQSGSQIRPGAPENVFVTSRMGLVGQKALAFMETPRATNGSSRTFLQSAPIRDMTAPVHLSWRGQFGSGGEMKVVLGYLGHPYLQMRFDDGDILVGGARVGRYLPGDHHRVFVTLEPEAGTYKLSFEGDGQYQEGVVQGSALAAKQKAGNLVIADFGIESVGKERLVYVLDDVRMSHNPQN